MQIWYANDAAGAGKIGPRQSWWDKIKDLGPAFGYFPNAAKSHLLVKPHLMSEARDIFQDTSLLIISEGKEYLGGAVGSYQCHQMLINLLRIRFCNHVHKRS